jgi:hypothetical protein
VKNWKPRIIELFRSRGAVVPDSPVLEELIQHLEELWRSALASGRSEEEAAAIVDAELAQLAAHTARFAATRAADAGVLRRSPFLGGAIYDVRHAWRLILSQPAFSAVVAVTLALGIGVSAAVLSLSAAVLLTPLPFPDSARLVALHATNSAGGFGNELSYLDFQDIRGDAAPFESVAAALRYSTTMLGGGGTGPSPGVRSHPRFSRRPSRCARRGPIVFGR